MEPFTLAALAALVVKIVSVVKSLGKDRNAVVTQALTWAVGVAVAFLAAHADLTSALVVADRQLGSLDAGSLVLVGLSLSSLGSFAYDVKKSVDGTDSAAEPRLLPPTAP